MLQRPAGAQQTLNNTAEQAGAEQSKKSQTNGRELPQKSNAGAKNDAAACCDAQRRRQRKSHVRHVALGVCSCIPDQN